MPTSPTGRKILVADDEPDILATVKRLLRSQGFLVVTAEDGEEALETACSEKPDAILLDIRMPKLDGLQVCSKLKADPETAEIPVGFLTALKDLETYTEAQQRGGLLYLIKPFEPERLLTFVRLLLSRPESQ